MSLIERETPRKIKFTPNINPYAFGSTLVEFGNTEEIFSTPKHNYTKNLLTSIPYPDPKGREKRKSDRLLINN